MKTYRFLPLLWLLASGILPLSPALAAPPASSNQKSKINNPQSSISSNFTTTPYGRGTRTTDSQGRVWTTTPYGNGSRTTGPAGSSYTTTRYGLGTHTTGTGAPPPVVPALPRK